jgi:hypothetical protein
MIRKLFALIMFLISAAAIVMVLFGVVAVWDNETISTISSTLGGDSIKEEFSGLEYFLGKTNKDNLLNFKMSTVGMALLACLALTAILALVRVISPGSGGDILAGLLVLAALAAGIMLLVCTQEFAIEFDTENSVTINSYATLTGKSIYEVVSKGLSIGSASIIAALCCLANVVLGVLDTIFNRKK